MNILILTKYRVRVILEVSTQAPDPDVLRCLDRRRVPYAEWKQEVETAYSSQEAALHLLG